ncbi:MAG: hypothetical protein ACXVWX_03385 [Nocardioides sp.]
MRRTLSALSGLSALLLALSLAACGSSGTEAQPAASRTASSTAAPSQSQTGQALFASMTTAMAKAHTAKVTFSSAIAQQRVTGAGSFRFSDKDLAAAMTVRVPGQGTVRVVLLPSAFYVRLPASSGIAAGRPWLEIARGTGGDAASKAFGPLMDQLKQSFDPQGNLGVLRATTSIKPSGTERIGGVPTTKYVAVVDLAKASRLAAGSLAEQYRTLLQSGVTTVRYSIWVDGDQLPRRFRTVVPMPQGDVTATGTYTDWGKPVRIQAPPAGQVTTTGGLTGATRSG